MPILNHFLEFRKVVNGALDELRDILSKETIVTRVLTIPLGFGNSTGDFAVLLDSVNRSEGSTEAITVPPRKLKQYRGAPNEVNEQYPLVVVFETPTSLRFQKAVLLHEFGHARKDYPTIWELLEATSYHDEIWRAENENLLQTGWNPFGNNTNADPFREYVADQLAARYLPQDVKAIEELQLASLRKKAEEGIPQRNFFLQLFLRIVGELSGATFPDVHADSASISIVRCIRRNDFQGYVIQIVSELLHNGSSPLSILGEKAGQVTEEITRALRERRLT
jgi:hypothetical protein